MICLQTWSHDSEERAFTPERSSGLEASKCLLCVESVRIRPDGATQDRTLLITTASDGLCVNFPRLVLQRGTS